MESPPTKSRRPWKIVAIVAAAVVVLVVGGPFLYIHVFSSSAPAKLTIDNQVSSGTSTTLGPATAPLDGTWKVGSGSQAGYRVNEVLFGQTTTAVGRTSSVTGQMVIAGDQVSSATFTVDMTTMKSNKSQRDEQFQGRIMNTSQFPHATFTTTAPIALSPVPTNGVTIHPTATGNLTLHGVTKPLSLNVEINGFGPDPYGGTRSGFSAKGELSRKAFDVKFDAPMEGGGAVLSDKIQLVIESELILRKDETA